MLVWYHSSHLYPPPPILTHYILIMHVKPFQPLLPPVLYVPRCPWPYLPRRCYWTLPSSSCRRLTPLAQAGMETPTGVYLAWRNWPSICHRWLPPLYSPHCPLYPSPLVTLYLFLFAFTPFRSLPFGVPLPTPPFHGNGLAPRSNPIAAVPYICI